jgi:hypothetical protein
MADWFAAPLLVTERNRGARGVCREQNDSETALPNFSSFLLLYVIAYLGRINIGFAALTMNKELAN